MTQERAAQLSHTLPLLIPVVILAALAATALEPLFQAGVHVSLAALVVALVRVSQALNFWQKNELRTRDEWLGWAGLWIGLLALAISLLAIAVNILASLGVVLAIVSVIGSVWSMIEARTIKKAFWQKNEEASSDKED